MDLVIAFPQPLSRVSSPTFAGLTLAAGGILNWVGRSRINSPADGVVGLTDAAATSFSRLVFGGTSSSFPSWKRSAANFEARLADDSGFCNVAVNDVIMPTTGQAQWSTKGSIVMSADGVHVLRDNASTSYGRLTLGGATSSFPAIKRNAAAINFRLGDDSADAAITTGSIVASGSIVTAAGATYQFNGSSAIAAPSDGVLKISNNAATDFTRLQFGGTTSSFPALKKNSTALNVRLADDSADAPITAAGITASGIIAGAGGLKRVTAQFDMTSNTTLTNVTGLSVALAASTSYLFRAVLFTVSNVAGGVKAAVAHSGTVTKIDYEGFATNAAAIGAQTRSAASAGAVAAVTAVTAALIEISGTIVTNSSGNLTIQFAQNASNGAASSVLIGSYMEVFGF